MKITGYIENCPVCNLMVNVSEDKYVSQSVFMVSEHKDESGNVCEGSKRFLYINTNTMNIGPRGGKEL